MFRRVDTDRLFKLCEYPVRVSSRQIDLVDHRQKLQIIFDGDIDIGDGLGFNPLCRIDDQQCAFGRSKRTTHFIGEVHMTRSVDQVEDILLTIFFILETNTLRFDRDTTLFFDIHRIHHLRRHLTVRNRPALLDDPVCKCGLSMINMCNDRKITNIRLWYFCHSKPFYSV